MTPTPPDPTPARPIPGRIWGVLKVIQTLIAHARHFVANATTLAAAPEFAPAAALFGTYDVPVLMLRMQRGILRALALQRYLLDRAARGRNLRFIRKPFVELQPHHRPPAPPPPNKRSAPSGPRRKEPALLRDDDPGAYYLPTPEELDAEVRRRPIGRTITYICLDLGVFPSHCDGIFWNKVDRVLHRYGGSLHRLWDVRAVREEAFQRERDRRPETWHIQWRAVPKSAIRQALGCIIGEPPPGLPAIVPS